MAELCRFYGIVIVVFFGDAGRHNRPHIHAFSAEYAAAFAIDDGSMIVGKMPGTARKLIKKFIELRRAELTKAWETAQSGRTPPKVLPIRVR